MLALALVSWTNHFEIVFQPFQISRLKMFLNAEVSRDPSLLGLLAPPPNNYLTKLQLLLPPHFSQSRSENDENVSSCSILAALI